MHSGDFKTFNAQPSVVQKQPFHPDCLILTHMSRMPHIDIGGHAAKSSLLVDADHLDAFGFVWKS